MSKIQPYTDEQLKNMIEELRYGLKCGGWFPPHSFKLRDEDEENEKRNVLVVERSPTYLPKITNQMVREVPKEKLLQIRREMIYRVHYDPWEGGIPENIIGVLDVCLKYAARRNYTLIQEVRTDWPDIWFIVNPQRTGLEKREDHRKQYQDWLGMQDAKLGDFLVETVSPEHWYLVCQEFDEHGYLQKGDRIIPWYTGNDQYLIHMAECWIKYLVWKVAYPGASYYTSKELLEDKVSLPKGGTFVLPDWLERIIEKGYYA